MTESIKKLIQASNHGHPYLTAPLVAPLHPAAIQQPLVQQLAPQQPVPQLPDTGIVSCPVEGCTKLLLKKDLNGHLAQAHGYECAAREHTISERSLRRKQTAVVRSLFVRDIRKLAWDKARLIAIEEAIRQIHKSYASCHDLSLNMQRSIQEKDGKRREVINKLILLRNEMKQTGMLYNQTGQPQGS